MADSSFETLPFTDSEAMNSMLELASELSVGNPRFVIELAKGLQTTEVPLADVDQQVPIQLARQEPLSSTWRNLLMRFKNRKLDHEIHLQRDELGVCKVKVTLPNESAPDDAARLLKAVHNRFTRFNRTTALDKALGPELAEFYRRREEGLLRLEGLTQKLVEENESYRRRVDQEKQEDGKRLAEELRAGREQLDNLLSEKEAAIRTREQTIETEKAALDLRSAQQVRRDNVKGLKSTLAGRAQSFTLTSDTKKKRWPIHVIFIALLLVSAGIAAVGLFVPPGENETGALLWQHLLRVPGGIVGFAFAAVFYIRWNDQWFRQHADEEFRMRQLELDIDRASWVTELALELRDEKGELPAALVDRLSGGLFAPRTSEGVRHPSQDILSTIIGASSRLKLTLPGGIEADIGRSGIKKVQQELEKT
jgi:hypothetical protein